MSETYWVWGKLHLNLTRMLAMSSHLCEVNLIILIWVQGRSPVLHTLSLMFVVDIVDRL